MARLRLATVEYRHCEQCGADYAGSRCPQCAQRASVLTERRLRSLLIVDDPRCPLYERQQRWRCRSCGSLFEPPPVPRFFGEAVQCRCGAVLFDRAAVATMIDGAATPLAQAQRLVAAIKRRKRCRACGATLSPPCWCPVCAASRLATSSALPPRPTWVYVPTGNRCVAVDDLGRELGDPAFTEDGSPSASTVDDMPPDAEDERED